MLAVGGAGGQHQGLGDDLLVFVGLGFFGGLGPRSAEVENAVGDFGVFAGGVGVFGGVGHFDGVFGQSAFQVVLGR